jgi:hypothetical protein
MLGYLRRNESRREGGEDRQGEMKRRGDGPTSSSRVKNGGESREVGVKVEAIFKGTARKEFGFAEDHGVRSTKRCETHLKMIASFTIPDSLRRREVFGFLHGCRERFLDSSVADSPHSKRVIFEAVGDARHSLTRLRRNRLGNQGET